MKIQSFLFFLILAISISGCLGKKQLDVKFKDPSAFQTTTGSLNISTVAVVSNQLIIRGSGLGNITSVKLSEGGVDQTLTVESATAGEIIAKGVSTVNIGVGKIFDMILSDANGAVTFPVNFSLDNGSVTAAMLASMGATPGQVLKYTLTGWAPVSQTETQAFIGTWDATTTIPDITATVPGDYYVVSVAFGTYAVGDWIISDGYAWSKLAYSKTSVSSFQNRKGIVTLVPADYLSLKAATTPFKIPGSSLKDLADVDLPTTPLDGQVLKWDTDHWEAGTAASSTSISLTSLSATAPLAYNNTTGVFSLATADLLATPLTNLASGSGAVIPADTLLGAFGKLMAVPSDYVSKSSTGSMTLSGSLNLTGPASYISVPTAFILAQTDVTNVEYVTNAIAGNGVWSKGTGASSSTINYAGNVGIGTATPGQKLTVVGDTSLTGGLAIAHPTFTGAYSIAVTANNQITFSNSGIGGTFLTAGPTNSVSTGNQSIQSTIRGANFGTSIANVDSVVNISALVGRSSGTNASASLNITNPINNTGTYSGIARGIYYNPTLTSLTGTTHRAIETVTGDVIFGSTSGSVGIGTTGPVMPLHVSGNSITSGTIYFGGNSIVAGNNTASLSNTGLNFNLNSGAGGPFFVGAGVKTNTSSGGNLTVYAQDGYSTGAYNGGDLILRSGAQGSTGTNGVVKIQNGNAEVIRINASGNVGIGATTPASKLHVGAAPTASANYGLLSLGSGAFDGVTAGYFGTSSSSNSSGTVIAVNAALGYVGDLVNFQVAGASRFKIDSSGNATISGTNSTAPSQTAASGSSLMNRDLVDTRVGMFYKLVQSSDLSATSTSTVTSSDTVTLPAGTYKFYGLLHADTASNTAGITSQISLTVNNSDGFWRAVTYNQAAQGNTYASFPTGGIQMRSGGNLFEYSLAGFVDAPNKTTMGESDGIVTFASQTVIRFNVAQRSATDGANPAILRANSFMTFHKLP